jgi:hypothetical protein
MAGKDKKGFQRKGAKAAKGGRLTERGGTREFTPINANWNGERKEGATADGADFADGEWEEAKSCVRR